MARDFGLDGGLRALDIYGGKRLVYVFSRGGCNDIFVCASPLIFEVPGRAAVSSFLIKGFLFAICLRIFTQTLCYDITF